MNFTIGFPQAIWIALALISCVIHICNHGGEQKKKQYNGVTHSIDVIITAAILYWGGFFG